MAAAAECVSALGRLADQLAAVDPGTRSQHAVDRTISVHVPDLDTTWSGRLADGLLVDITSEPRDKAQIRITAASDDLVAVTSGALSFGRAWVAGKVRIDASPFDLLRLRVLL